MSRIIAAYEQGRTYGNILRTINETIKDRRERERWILVLKREENQRARAGKGTTTLLERWFTRGI